METNLQLYSRLQAMVRKDAKDVATEVYRDLGTQYNVPEVPVHQHTGTDSPLVSFKDLGDNLPYLAIKSITLSKDQILALHTTPISLVGPFLNYYVIVEAIDAKLPYGSNPYAGANNLEFRYTDGSGAKVTADISTTFLNSSATAYSHVAGVTTELVPIINKPVVASIPVANPTAGNSQIIFTIKYRLVPQ